MTSSELWRPFAAAIRASQPYRQLLDGAAVARRLPLPAVAWVMDLLAEDRGRPLLAIVPREAGLSWSLPLPGPWKTPPTANRRFAPRNDHDPRNW